ncbi:MAG TPA: hypothetical protein VIO64_13300 [Pseudobacteroides sp.]|uniref:hypothetical protein n=1 Tax=Pseudobacteroides sp. TaxID=1968840 RepID=UPI002F9459D9
MRHYYCSTFSRDYVYKGLLLYYSMERWDKDFHYFIICLHDDVKYLLEKMDLKHATLITLREIEEYDKELLQIKSTRSDKEYAWTSKASACLYILQNYEETDHITWLDGDTLFCSDPDPIFNEWGDYSIMLTEERWRKPHRRMGFTNGFYNTGFMGFKKDKYGLECLKWFRARLIEWCYDKWENGLWSDQVYVNDWLERFQNVGVIKNMGVNITPYIIRGCKVDLYDGEIYVNHEKLILYHYYGFKYFDGNEFDLCGYKMNFHDNIIKWLYIPYIQASNHIMKFIGNVHKGFYELKPRGDYFIRNYFNLKANEGEETGIHHICTIFSKDYLVKGLALYISLKKNMPNFHLWVLCTDDLSYNFMKKINLENTTIFQLRNLEGRKLYKAKETRKVNEYCWTLKAPFIQFILKNNYNINSILYCDADLFFFNDVSKVYEEWGKASIFISKLWMNPKSEKMFGSFSAGLIGFMRDKTAFKCLCWWKIQCIKWCYNKIEKDRWSDQKYLDYWPQMFGNVKVTENMGINLGPWNVRRVEISKNKKTVFCNNNELIVYHFSGFDIYNECEYELCNRRKLPENAVRYIYGRYVKQIRKVIGFVKTLDNGVYKSIWKDSSTNNFINYFKRNRE